MKLIGGDVIFTNGYHDGTGEELLITESNTLNKWPAGFCDKSTIYLTEIYEANKNRRNT